MSSRFALRRALDQYLKTGTAWEAFLIDFFPRIAQERASGMNRVEQVNLLFSYTANDEIEAALAERLADDPPALAQFRADLGRAAAREPGGSPMADSPATAQYHSESASVRLQPGPWTTAPAAVLTPTGDPPPLIFIEYDDEDRALVDDLLRQLKPMEKSGRFRTFERRQIPPGADWQKATTAQLGQAALIVLVISPDLLANDGFPTFLAQAQALAQQGSRLIPLLARPAMWELTPLGPLAPLPADGRFLSARGRNEREQALVDIVQVLGRIAQAQARPAPQRQPAEGQPAQAAEPPSPRPPALDSEQPAPRPPALASELPSSRPAGTAPRPDSPAGGAARTESALPSPRFALPVSYVLHLSDLHFTSNRQVMPALDLLEADLEQLKSGVPRLDAVIISGDLTQVADPAEFAAATGFLRELRTTYGLGPQQVIVVPGNHDGSWAASGEAYARRAAETMAGLAELGRAGLAPLPQEPDEALYKRRFVNFAAFYESLCEQPYPLEFEHQVTLHPFPALKLLVVGLNSAWQCDHLPEYRGRASINSEALSGLLRTLRREPTYHDWLKIAVWHHPVQSDGEDRMKNTGFLDRLAQAGFRLGLHGHLHSAQLNQHAYDVVADGRRLGLLGAGTFGAPTKEWRAGVPLQYQILRIEGSRLRVLSRARDNPEGPWRGDGRWVVGSETRTYYEIDL